VGKLSDTVYFSYWKFRYAEVKFFGEGSQSCGEGEEKNPGKL